MKSERHPVYIQGFGVDSFTFEQAVCYLNNNSGQVITINPEMIDCAKKNPEFADIISKAELVVPDGIGVEIGLKILGHKVRRIPGIELGKALVKEFSDSGKAVAFVGAKPKVAERASESLKSEIPALNVVYIVNGYFDNEDIVLSELKEKKPDLILTALGSPKQEFFNFKLKQLLPDSVMIGLGGSFDVWAGEVERAPHIYRKLGLEWLYRTIKDPKRFKRIFPVLPLFVLRVVKERLLR